MQTLKTLFFGLIVMLALVGCSQAATPAPAPAPAAKQEAPKQEAPKAAAPTQAPAPKQEAPKATEAPKAAAPAPAAKAAGGALVMATRGNSEPANMDAHIDPYASTWLMNSFVTDTLARLSPEGKYEPSLAESWTVSADGKTWTVKLRAGVKFQDGTPFNAAAAKFNFDRVVNPDTKSALMANYLGAKDFESSEAVDDTTLRIKFKNAVPNLLWGLAIMPVWSPTAVQKFGKDYDKNLTGTGAYKMTEWVKGSHIKFTKDPTYDGAKAGKSAGPALLDTVTVRFVGEDAILGQVLKTAEVNMVMELPAQAVADYKGKPDFQVIPGYQPGTGMQFMMNVSKPPFDDVKVRQAMRYAYDQEKINATLYDNNYIPIKGPLTKFSRCYYKEGETAYKLDLDKARALLDEAGWKVNPNTRIREKDGKPFTVTMTMLHHQEMGEYLATQFRQIGVELKVEVVPGPVQLQKATGGEFDLMYQRLRDFEPDVLYSSWFSGNLRPGGWAWSRFKDARLDEILTKSQATGDQEERCKLFTEAQKILTEQTPSLPTVDNPIYYALKKEVKGFQLGAVGSQFFVKDMYIEK